MVKMVTKLRSNYDYNSSFFLDVSIATLTKARKRWRLAYMAVYFSQTMLSLAREIVSDEKKGHPHLRGNLPSSSYTILNIDPMSSCDGGNEIELDSQLKTKISEGHDFPAIDQTKLAEMVKDKNLYELGKYGGVAGLATALATDPERGINGDDQDIFRRHEMFGSNTYRKQPPKGILHFILEAFRDTTILILMACAALSLGFGIKEHGGKEGWYEGGSIFAAVFLVIVVSAGSNFRQERQFHNLSKISSDIKIDVMRQGRRQKISIFDIVVGDVVFLRIGDQIAADGLFLDGHSLQIDESSMTGESDHVEVDSVGNPFLLSGSKVADGYARMLVTSVGMNTRRLGR